MIDDIEILYLGGMGAVVGLSYAIYRIVTYKPGVTRDTLFELYMFLLASMPAGALLAVFVLPIVFMFSVPLILACGLAEIHKLILEKKAPKEKDSE